MPAHLPPTDTCRCGVHCHTAYLVRRKLSQSCCCFFKNLLINPSHPWECQQFGVGIHLNQAGYMARALFLQEGSAFLTKPKMWPIPASWLPQLSTQQMSFQCSFRACLLYIEQGNRSLSFGLNSNRKRPWIEQSIYVEICWMLLLDGNSGFLFVYVTPTLI